MPPVSVDSTRWLQTLRRALIVGPPNTFKTRSLLTWPRPLHHVTYPGEQGAGSIEPQEGVFTYMWDLDPTQPVVSSVLLAEVRQLTLDILSGAKGPVATFAGDGLHKLFYTVMMNIVTGGAFREGEDFPAQLYNRAYALFNDYLGLTTRFSGHTVFTCWAGVDPTALMAEPGMRPSDAPKAIFPDFPKNLAKNILGEFSMILYSEVLEGQGGPGDITGRTMDAGVWRLAPTVSVRAAGVKLPLWLIRKLPAVVPQDWGKLEAYILAQVAKHEKEITQ